MNKPVLIFSIILFVLLFIVVIFTFILPYAYHCHENAGVDDFNPVPKSSNNNAYVTLITKRSYMPGVLALIQSTKEHCKINYDFIVLHSNLLQTDLDKITILGGILVPIKPLLVSSKAVISGGRFQSASSGGVLDKVHIFSLVDYETVIYLDSDMIVVRDINQLFEWHNPGTIMAAKGSPLFNAGLMVFNPSETDYIKLKELALTDCWYKGKCKGWGRTLSKLPGVEAPIDQEFFCHYFYNRWIKLPPMFNCKRVMHRNNKCKVIHYTNKYKPWKTRMIVGSAIDWLQGTDVKLWRKYYISAMKIINKK